jgi:uncharacterized protein (TIGR02328 family)
MRLWHEELLEVLPKQWLLGQNRECCALRGAGWGKKHATVDYVFTHPYGWLVEYHWRLMDLLYLRYGVHVDERWEKAEYRGRRTDKLPFVGGKVELTQEQIDGRIYPEHDAAYMRECLENLRRKGKVYDESGLFNGLFSGLPKK